MIVFIVSNVPFNTPEGPPRFDEATAWLRTGVNVLPTGIAKQPVQTDHILSVLIYEFTKAASDGSVKMVEASAVTPQRQLDCTGVKLSSN